MSRLRGLVFVYNADRGLFNAISDSVHKVVAPSTYACNLCRLTHGLLRMRDRWRRFLDSLDFELEFLHRDELGEREIALPAILGRDAGGALEVLVDADRLAVVRDLDELEALVRAVLTSGSSPGREQEEGPPPD